MESSVYASLQGDIREFRLLTLEPSTDRHAPVRCKLNRASFDDNDVKYTALSYTWGDPLSTTTILVNGATKRVTIDLEAALRHIRQLSCAMVLWIDAICINQEDLAEKNHQVEMMKEIYTGAELVIAWLGTTSDDSDIAMEVLGKGYEGWKAKEGSSTVNERQAHNTPARGDEGDSATPSGQSAASMLVATMPSLQIPNPASLTDSGDTDHLHGIYRDFRDGDHTTEQSGCTAGNSQPPATSSNAEVCDKQIFWKDFTRTIQGLSNRETLAISKFLKRSWWTRIWVVQEVMLAKKVVFKCGYAEVPGDKMSSWGLGPLSILNIHMLCGNDELTWFAIPVFNLLEVLRYPMNNNDAMDCLFSFGTRGTSRPHDHIYGILGILSAKDRNLFGSPNYGCRVEDLFINVAAKLMVEYNSLELLLAAGTHAPLTAASSTEINLPSWVPDWTRSCSILKSARYSREKIGFFSGPIFQFSEDLSKLIVEGLKFDVIESVKIIPATAQGEMPIWQDALMTGERPKVRGGLPSLQRQIAAQFLDITDLQRLDNDRGFEFVSSFFKELENYRNSLSRCEASSGLDKSDYLAGFLHWTGETRHGRTDEEILEKVFNVEAARYFKEWYQRQSSADLHRMYMKYTIFRNNVWGTAGCSMFRTCKGYFGLTWAAAAAGDILCAVPSCGAPLVLREIQSSVYRLVGPSSSIDGTLHGELPQAAEKGEIARGLFTIV